MTDTEIIKALECFAIDKDFDERQCIGCVFENEFCAANMSYNIAKITLDLINRQKAEIERLKKEAVGIPARTLKRFEKEIKDVQFTIGQTWEIQCALKDVLKEMAGDF